MVSFSLERPRSRGHDQEELASMHGGRQFSTAVALALVVLSVAPSGTHAANSGNATAAQRCQKGGWMDLMTSSGAAFTSQGACVAYAAKGGDLSTKTTASLVFELGTCHPTQLGALSCPDATLVGSGLQPGGIVYRCDGGLPPNHPDAFCYPQFDIESDGTVNGNNWGSAFLCSPGVVYSYNAPTAAGPLVFTSDTCQP